MRALGGTKKMPLQGWFAEASSKNAAYCVFYLSGRLTARDIDDTVTYAAPGYSPADVQGQDITDFLKAIRVTATGMECPVYVKRHDFDRSQLDEKSAIVDAQVSAIYARCANRVANLFKDCATNKKRTVMDTNGKTFDLAIPETQFYGDSTQLFDTDANIKSFRMMMLKAQEMAEAQGLKVAIVSGTEGRGELANATRFSDRDFAPGETTTNGQPLSKIFGGQVESLWGFDSVFYPNKTESVGYIIVVLEKAFGQDNKDVAVTPEANYIADKKAYLLDVEVYNSTELLNPEGFFVFTYKRDVAGSGAAGASLRTVSTPQAQPDIDKVIELENIKLKRAKEEKAAYEAKAKALTLEKANDSNTENKDPKDGKTE